MTTSRHTSRRSRRTPAPPAVEAAPLVRIVRPAEVCRLLGLTRQALWLMRRRGDFPPGLKLSPGGSIGWREDVLREWLASRPAA
ncbi:MAG TPA: AlpA family phage regulatory protein [Vicinamibacteria bacterium]|nr:AlpA family phage regulatory protein [Vicinamibacteria bacterium]